MAVAKLSLTHPTEAGIAAVTPYVESRDAVGTAAANTNNAGSVRGGEKSARRVS